METPKKSVQERRKQNRKREDEERAAKAAEEDFPFSEKTRTNNGARAGELQRKPKQTTKLRLGLENCRQWNCQGGWWQRKLLKAAKATNHEEAKS
ncbi:hypothetical protein MRB53_017012 [Persea americana]|uniref:Uncharacterized protein n=1 Tax=Persea americana TaxID=3435 RepID=A0ACC2M4C0_PERAE|nr:hypothetical protein MRB53_017012 [Persea americana]